MTIKTRLLATALAGLLPLSLTAAPANQAEIEQIVHQYLVSHPEILIEMSDALRAKQQAAQDAEDLRLLKQHAKALYHNPADPSGGPADATLTLVEFIDYNCGYCKRAWPSLKAAIDENPKLRHVYKEFPILSEGSVLAAKAALAVHQLTPQHYLAFHNALMAYQGSIKSEEQLAEVAKSLKLDWSSIKTAMQSPEVEKAIQANHQLAQQLGVTGTPAFFVGDKALRGAPRSPEDLLAVIQSAKPL
ncbi:MAG: DsbA family protein [Aeromonadaceae bacterium]|nr:DsbA family protein [Aeromonadaceae bacterium]